MRRHGYNTSSHQVAQNPPKTLTLVRMCAHRYMWRHNYNTSFYQVANQLSSPVLKSTVQSTIIRRNGTTFPSTQDYFNILQTCALGPAFWTASLYITCNVQVFTPPRVHAVAERQGPAHVLTEHRASVTHQLTGCCSAADRPALVEQYVQYFANNSFDVMVMPMTPATAPPIYGCVPDPLPDTTPSVLCMHTPTAHCHLRQGTHEANSIVLALSVLNQGPRRVISAQHDCPFPNSLGQCASKARCKSMPDMEIGALIMLQLRLYAVWSRTCCSMESTCPTGWCCGARPLLRRPSAPTA